MNYKQYETFLVNKFMKSRDKYIRHHSFPVSPSLSKKGRARLARQCFRKLRFFKNSVGLIGGTLSNRFETLIKETLHYHKRRIIVAEINGETTYLSI